MEFRLCLSAAPVVAGVGLKNDTGTPGDNVTEDPTLTGSITNDDTNQVNVEIDFDGDGSVDHWVVAEPDGTFEIDPTSSINYGEVTIKIRAAELVFDSSELLFSEWVSITFDYQPPPNDPPSIASLGLKNDTGTPGDNITDDPTLEGSVTNDGDFDSITIEIDYNEDGVVDDLVYVEADGTFEIDPSQFINYGEVTIAVRAAETNIVTSEILFSGWTSITFTYKAPPNDPPSIVNLSLLNDTGDAGDNVTQDPTLTGAVLNDGEFDNINIEVDFNGDGTADDWFYLNADGTFQIDPGSHISPGPVTIFVRAVEWGVNGTEYLLGEWASITFTFDDTSGSSSGG